MASKMASKIASKIASLGPKVKNVPKLSYVGLLGRIYIKTRIGQLVVKNLCQWAVP